MMLEKITIFICAIRLTFPPIVYLVYLKIIYTKVKFDLNKFLYKQYFPEDKKQTKLQNRAKFEEKHPKTFRSIYQFKISKTKDWEHIRIFLTRLLFEESAANPASEMIYLAQAETTRDWLLISSFCKP